ncbi:hypothetical protein [Reyranella sp.]|uniref:hypothetical protein n=1 Tax=Reyranella sp. TaxID=1929291 RepID=UPI003D0964D3
MFAFLGTIQAKIIAGLLAVALVGGAIVYIYGKGERAGSSEIKARVATETVKTLDAARISKERTDEEVHRTPYDDRADGLR